MAQQGLESMDSKHNVQPLPKNLGLRHAHSREEAMKLNFMELVAGGHGVLFGSRIPKHYFMVKGFGQTDAGDGADPWETGSYDLALESAGIMDFNITQYSSVIPPESSKIEFHEAKPFFRHGAVMEAIMARTSIPLKALDPQIRRKRDNAVIGGYAAEYSGHARESEARRILQKDLEGIFKRRFDQEDYEVFEEDFMIQESEVEQGFGTALAAICFVTYVEPVFVNMS
ncbi:hypothetical protein SELMODRAFT_429737 [Selaginella moellendorffii]|uniref:arginine decarboxylase n=1 Tax=Selaginella moellendorffii TaxID=88036 RepID=D8T752_SELML|nr:hypothetical protein SELMODRAFT_429737 [Selaginella moellendorffii]